MRLHCKKRYYICASFQSKRLSCLKTETYYIIQIDLAQKIQKYLSNTIPDNLTVNIIHILYLLFYFYSVCLFTFYWTVKHTKKIIIYSALFFVFLFIRHYWCKNCWFFKSALKINYLQLTYAFLCCIMNSEKQRNDAGSRLRQVSGVSFKRIDNGRYIRPLCIIQ